MSAILDILIIVIIALSIFFAAKRGFIRTLLGGTSFLIAVAVALAFINPVRDYLGNSSVADKARASLSDTLAGFVSSDSESYDPKLLEDNSAFMNMISVFGIDTEEIREKWQEWRTENTEKLRVDLEEYVSKPVVHAVATVVAFLVLFLGSLLILKLALFLLDRFFRLPVLRQANTFLGVLLGVILSAVRVYLFVALVNLLLPRNRSCRATHLFSSLSCPVSHILYPQPRKRKSSKRRKVISYSEK